MRSKRVAIAAGVIAVAVGAGAWAIGAQGDSESKSDAELPAAKAEIAKSEAAYDEQNAGNASDSESAAAIVAEKEAGHRKHLAELAARNRSPEPWPTGIFADPEAPISGQVFLGVNRWVGKLDGAYLAVYAGRAGEDAENGRVLGQWSDGRPGYTLDLAGTGPLEVVDATDAGTLRLRDAHGGEHVLDAGAGEWIAR